MIRHLSCPGPMRPELENLEAALRMVHRDHPQQSAFVDFASDLTPAECSVADHPARAAMAAQAWDKGPLDPLRDAALAVGSIAQWRLTYEGTKIDPDFMERFGCYCLIGEGGFWHSAEMAGYIVYMPAGLHYPWHQHPAEEMYLILAGEAEFALKGEPPRRVRAGDAVFHPGNAPHATTTTDAPLLAYVTWRNALDIAPRWSDPEMGA